MQKDMQFKIIFLSVFSILLAILAYRMFFLSADVGSDVFNFYHQAEWTKAGLKPYVDFVLEFPPASLFFFMIPSMFTADYDVYRILFSVMVLIFASASLYLVMKISDLLNKNWIVISLIVSLLIIIFTNNNSFFIKFDIIPVFFSLLSIYCYMTGRKNLAYFIMMMAALIKLYPILFLIVMIIHDASNMKHTDRENNLKNVAQRAFMCILAIMIVFIPYIVDGIGVTDILSFIGVQADRGFHTESVMGTLTLLLGNLGLIDYQLVAANNTYNVDSIISESLIQYWLFILISVLILTFLLIIFKNRSKDHQDHESLIWDMLIIAMAFILFNNIFSTQYLLWIFPLMALILLSKYNGQIVFYSTLLIMIATISIISLEMPFDLKFAGCEFVRDCILFFILYILIRGNANIKIVEKIQRAFTKSNNDTL